MEGSWQQADRDAPAQHHFTGKGMGLTDFRVPHGRRWLPAGSYPSARAWWRQEAPRPPPDPTASPLALTGPQPAPARRTPPAPLTSRPEAAPLGNPHPQPSHPPQPPSLRPQSPRRVPSAAPVPRRLHLPACNGAAPGARGAAGPPRGTLGMVVGRRRLRSAGWGRAAALVSGRNTAAIAAAGKSRCTHGPQDSALGDGERPPLLGSLGGGRAGGASGGELRAGLRAAGPCCGAGTGPAFLVAAPG